MCAQNRQPTIAQHQLPANFAFSQSSLQAYADCPRRFWLAFVEQLPWPAVEASPVQEVEEWVRLGSTFHLLVQRAEVGLDADLLAAGLAEPLAGWFANYLRHRPADLPTQHVEIEHILSIPIEYGVRNAESRMQQDLPVSSTLRTPDSELRIRLAAKYDLIAAEPGGRVVIMDWKTARKRTDAATLRQRWQSVVYPYVLVEASASLPWGPVQPEQVEMRYWFTAAPTQPVSFRYDSQQHAANRQRLHDLLGEILAGQREADFPKVIDSEINRRRFCNFCIYRSRCNRGVTAGDFTAVEDAEDFFAVDVDKALEFSLDELTELAF
jgi:PD-(D/E)XK nuclease superfamily